MHTRITDKIGFTYVASSHFKSEVVFLNCTENLLFRK
jgi:hypothetical protein